MKLMLIKLCLKFTHLKSQPQLPGDIELIQLVMFFVEWYDELQGWGQVKYLYLVLDAKYQVLGTYLVVWNSKILGTYLYLMTKVLDTCPSTQVLCQINKYSVLNLLFYFLVQYTIKHLN